jgi:hypothetical protein
MGVAKVLIRGSDENCVVLEDGVARRGGVIACCPGDGELGEMGILDDNVVKGLATVAEAVRGESKPRESNGSAVFGGTRLAIWDPDASEFLRRGGEIGRKGKPSTGGLLGKESLVVGGDLFGACARKGELGPLVTSGSVNLTLVVWGLE